MLSLLRREWREAHSDDTLKALRELIDQKDDNWLRLAAIKEMMDRLWGKSQQHVTLDADSTIAAVYETMDDIRRDLIESGFDHLEAPRLLKTIDVEQTKEESNK